MYYSILVRKLAEKDSIRYKINIKKVSTIIAHDNSTLTTVPNSSSLLLSRKTQLELLVYYYYLDTGYFGREHICADRFQAYSFLDRSLISHISLSDKPILLDLIERWL